MRWSLLLPISPAYSQCVQCFRTAAAQQAAGMRAMNYGIAIMLFLVLALLAALALFVYRRRGAA